MPVLDIVLPVYNEAHVLGQNVRYVVRNLERTAAYEWIVTIANNGSTDTTAREGRRLAEWSDRVRLRDYAKPGRGRALKRAWLASEADAVCYMDIDLSTDLGALNPLAEALLGGDWDLAVGTRLARSSRVERSVPREVLSRGLNLVIPAVLGTSFSDAQCGFKGATREAVRRIVPQIRSVNWFFDTELLVRAEDAGLRIREIPVRWTEDPDSRVRIGAAVSEQVSEIVRMWATVRWPRLKQRWKLRR